MKNTAADDRPAKRPAMIGVVGVTTSKSIAVTTDQDRIKEMRRLEQDRILFWGS